MSRNHVGTPATRALPYYRWYVRDYRASRNANALGYVARGLYRELLDECWEEGWIPSDPVRLSKICRCPVAVMVRAWKQLEPLFIPVEGLDGELLMNARLEDERTKEDSIRVKRRAAAAKGGQNAALARQVLANPGKCLSSSRAEQSSSSSIGQHVPALEGAHALAEPAESRCPECGVYGARLAAGIHRPECSIGEASAAVVGAIGMSA